MTVNQAPIYSKFELQVIDDISRWWQETNPFNDSKDLPKGARQVYEKYWDEHL